jgi:hypothetical protein
MMEFFLYRYYVGVCIHEKSRICHYRLMEIEASWIAVVKVISVREYILLEAVPHLLLHPACTRHADLAGSVYACRSNRD